MRLETAMNASCGAPAVTASLVRLGRVPLEDALTRMRDARERVISSAGPPAVFLVEHEPVYTIGRAGVRRGFPAGDPRRWPAVTSQPPPHPVCELERGGDVTWHGPGQCVVYPVLPLKALGCSLTAYVRALEAASADALAVFGVTAHARRGLTGVWVRTSRGEAKLGSIGVGCRRWVTCHGLSLNVSCDLSAFGAIVPCGICDARVTSLTELCPYGTPAPDELGEEVARALASRLGFALAPEAGSGRPKRPAREEIGCV